MSTNSQVTSLYKRLTANQRAKLHYLARLSGNKVHPEIQRYMPKSQIAEFEYYMRIVYFLTLVVETRSLYELERAKAMAYQQTTIQITRMKPRSGSTRDSESDQQTYEQKLLATSVIVGTASALRDHFDLSAAHEKAVRALGVAQKVDSPIARNLDETRWFLELLHGLVADNNRSLRPVEHYQHRATGAAWLDVLRKRYRVNLTD